jgi:serine/threonine-protein kinase
VADYATNLMWQHSSSPPPVTWKDAHAYIQQLNTMRYGGYADWRLPTLEELASLLEPTKSQKNMYLDPVFGTTQLWCWSADPAASSQETAWYVSFSSGGIQPHHIQNSAFVLAVRTFQESMSQ